MDNKEVKLNEKSLLSIIGFILLISIIIFTSIFISLRKDTELYNENTSTKNSYSKDSNYFDDLRILNASITRSKYDGWNSVVGEVENNSNEILYGYLEVSFYSSSDELVDIVSAPFDPISPGKKGTFKTPGTKKSASYCKVLSGTIAVKK